MIKLAAREDTQVVGKMHELIKKIRDERAKVADWQVLMRKRQVLEAEGKSSEVAVVDSFLDNYDDDIEMNLRQMENDFFESCYPERTLLLEFDALLKSGIATIERKRKIFEKLLGRNPKAILAHLLFDCQILARKILKLSKHGDLNSYLRNFISEVDKPWNHHLYDTKFLLLSAQYAEIHEKFFLEVETLERGLKTSPQNEMY